MFSYAGFVTIEVIVITTISSFLMLLDAISILKCKATGKDNQSKAIKLAIGNDYEEETDKPDLKKILTKRSANKMRDQEEFGRTDRSES